MVRKKIRAGNIYIMSNDHFLRSSLVRRVIGKSTSMVLSIFVLFICIFRTVKLPKPSFGGVLIPMCVFVIVMLYAVGHSSFTHRTVPEWLLLPSF